MQLSHKELRLIASLLEYGSELMSNQACNDFDLDRFGFTSEELIELDRKMQDYNGSPEDHDPLIVLQNSTMPDFFLASYFADVLQEMTKS